MAKVLKLLLVTIFILSIHSCDEEFVDIYKHSRVEKYDTHHLSVFRIPHVISSVSIDSDVDIIRIGGSYAERFHAKLSAIDKFESEAGVTIPIEASIPDGNYIIKVDSIPDRFIAKIENQLISIIEINNGYYSELENLNSKGSVDKPFVINSNDKFNKFIYALSKDEYHGAGFYFKQTSDFTWSNDEINQGEGLSSQSFAGNYDGGNNSIKGIVINGKDNTGIFTSLINGAIIQNLTIEGIAISSSEYYLGALAGQSTGHVRLRGIRTSGSISGKEYVGGLIGRAEGKLTLNNITIGTIINGKKYIGGVIGEAFTQDGLSIDSLYISNSFKIGNKNESNFVGGVLGLFYGGAFNISNTNIIYTSSVDDNVEIIAGNEYVGGLFGKIEDISASEIHDTKVIAPIMATKYIGGLIGYIDITNSLSISNCQLCPIIKQGDYIGGAIGYLNTSTDNLLSYNNINIVQSDNSDISIKGNNYVGGIFGYITKGAVTFTGENYLMTPIYGNSYVGGLAGEIESTTLNTQTILYGKAGTEISGLQIEANSYVGGFVGNMKSSTLKGTQSLSPTSGIQPFDESKASIICTVKGAGDKVGGAVGCANKSVINGVAVKANVINSSGAIYTGGIVGYFDDGSFAVTNCSFFGTVKGGDYTGGIAGEMNNLSQITQCINYGSIGGGDKTGGICGKINNKSDEPWINNCANVGDVTGSHYVAGIVGYISADGNEANDWTKIANCGNYGNITASSGDGGCVGGIVGKCDSDKIRVNHSANHGTITGNGTFKGIGGIAGSLGKDGILNELDNVNVYNCANTGKIISDKSGEAHMGGIVGYLEEGNEGDNSTDSQVHLCYNCGEVGPAKEATWGGMIGHCDYYTSLRYCINYGNTFKGDGGEAMIGTVVTAGIVHDEALYHLEGTGDNEGRNWSSTSFSKDKMNSLSTFSGFSENDWIVDKQQNMKGDGENTASRVILKECPFQNIIYTK